MERYVAEARSCVRKYVRLLGEDVIEVVHRETDLAVQVFEAKASSDESTEGFQFLQRVRVERAAMLVRLGNSLAFPPPKGSLADGVGTEI